MQNIEDINMYKGLASYFLSDGVLDCFDVVDIRRTQPHHSAWKHSAWQDAILKWVCAFFKGGEWTSHGFIGWANDLATVQISSQVIPPMRWWLVMWRMLQTWRLTVIESWYWWLTGWFSSSYNEYICFFNHPFRGLFLWGCHVVRHEHL